MGKTHIVQKFVRDHPPVFDELRGTTRVPVVAMQMPPEPLEHDFCEEFLMALGEVGKKPASGGTSAGTGGASKDGTSADAAAAPAAG